MTALLPFAYLSFYSGVLGAQHWGTKLKGSEVFGRVAGCELGDADDALVGLVLFEYGTDVINKNEK